MFHYIETVTIAVSHGEEIKLNLCSQEESSSTSQSNNVFQNNKLEFVWKHKYIAIKKIKVVKYDCRNDI